MLIHQRKELEREVTLQLKSAYHDGTSHIVMSRLQLIRRLAALTPRPRLHLTRFHVALARPMPCGVLASNVKLPVAIVPRAA